MDISPSAHINITPSPWVDITLAEWEWKLIVKARQLRASQKSATLQVQFSGPAMTLWVLTPAGRVE